MKPLNPIMAVLVIASVGASPLRARANNGSVGAGSNSSPVEAADDANPINALGKILAENPSARADAGKRIEDFLLKPGPDGKSFVADNAHVDVLGRVARDWGEKQGSAGDVASLYFVLGPGQAAPSWAKNDLILSKTFNPGMQLEQRLRDREVFAEWTGDGRINKTSEAAKVTRFLADAVKEARAVFDDPRTRGEIDQSIARNDTTALIVPGDDSRHAKANPVALPPAYTLDDLYVDGAEVADLRGRHDNQSSKISMKIFTKRLDDGTITSEIGIFDITDTNDIFGRRFPIDSGDQSFVLDDRTPGQKKYELKFGIADENGNREISFSRPGGDSAIKTSVSTLFKKRADQVVDLAGRQGGLALVKVGDEEFYALSEGGPKNGMSLFSKSVIDGRGAGDPRDLKPAFYAAYGERGPDGRNRNIIGKNGGPNLGKIGDTSYHLEFNEKGKYWEVKEGEGDLPPKTAPAGDKPDGGKLSGDDPGGEKSAGNKSDGESSGGEPVETLEGGMSIEKLEELALKSPECKKNPDDTKGLSSKLKGYGIISCSNASDGNRQIILVPKTANNPDQQLVYSSTPESKLLRARFVGHYLVLEFDKNAQYLDLLLQDKGDATRKPSFVLSGSVSGASRREKKFSNAEKFSSAHAFADALRNYMDIAAGSEDANAAEKVPTRVKEVLGGKAYTLTGGFSKGALVVTAVSESQSYSIWPKMEKPQALSDSAPYKSLSGAANAMDGGVSSVDEAFPSEILLPESRTAVAMSGYVKEDIALYKSVDEPKKYYLMFKYEALDPKDPAQKDGEKVSKTFRQKQFEVFGSSSPFPTTKLEIQGLVGGTLVTDRMASGYRFISGTDRKRGVLAMFQNKQVIEGTPKNKAGNCVGPIVWWGLADREAAMTVCREDKF